MHRRNICLETQFALGRFWGYIYALKIPIQRNVPSIIECSLHRRLAWVASMYKLRYIIFAIDIRVWALFSCGHIINLYMFLHFFIYPYSPGLLHCHWDNHMIDMGSVDQYQTTAKHAEAQTKTIILKMNCSHIFRDSNLIDSGSNAFGVVVTVTH